MLFIELFLTLTSIGAVFWPVIFLSTFFNFPNTTYYNSTYRRVAFAPRPIIVSFIWMVISALLAVGVSFGTVNFMHAAEFTAINVIAVIATFVYLTVTNIWTVVFFKNGYAKVGAIMAFFSTISIVIATIFYAISEEWVVFGCLVAASAINVAIFVFNVWWALAVPSDVGSELFHMKKDLFGTATPGAKANSVLLNTAASQAVNGTLFKRYNSDSLTDENASHK